VSTKEAERKELEELILKKAVKKAEPAPLDSPDQPLLFGGLAEREDVDSIHERAMFHLRVAEVQRKMIGA
jgi:hypothetical protein